MSIYHSAIGNVELAATNLADDTLTDLLGPLEGQSIIPNVHVANTSSAIVNLDLELYDPATTTTYPMLKAHSIPENSSEYAEIGPLPIGWILRGKSSASGGDLTVCVTYTLPQRAGAAR